MQPLADLDKPVVRPCSAGLTLRNLLKLAPSGALVRKAEGTEGRPLDLRTT